jgi:D-glycero-D-manno-heptose 1,7-bisphosphate phosphatase
VNKAAFLDRDGVINRKAPKGQYVTRWEDLHLLPGVSRAIALLNRAGFRVIVITNQRCIAKGLLTCAELQKLHALMCSELLRAGATIDAIYYCPHEIQDACTCRKPQPGMLLEAALAHNIDLSASWLIGDSAIDIESGNRAGCRTARVLPADEQTDGDADIIVGSLLDAVQRILQLDCAANGQ